MTAYGAPAARARRPAEQDVVAEDEVGGQALPSAAAFASTQGVELLARAVLQELHLVALVAVEDEHGQQPADVGPDDLRAAEVVALRVRLLAETVTSCPARAPLARELPRVDVRPRSAEQVPVPEEDAHPGILRRCGLATTVRGARPAQVRWKYSA